MTDLIIATAPGLTRQAPLKNQIFDTKKRFKYASIVKGNRTWILRVDGEQQNDSFTIELDDEMRHKIISFFLGS